MADLLGDARTMRYYPRPYSRAEVGAWIARNRRLYAERGFGLWLITSRRSGEPIGDCGLTPQLVEGVEEIEVGYHVYPRFQRRGYATEAALAVRECATVRLGLRRLVAIIHPGNAASRRVAESIGLAFERDIDHPDGTRSLYSGDGGTAAPGKVTAS